MNRELVRVFFAFHGTLPAKFRDRVYRRRSAVIRDLRQAEALPVEPAPSPMLPAR